VSERYQIRSLDEMLDRELCASWLGLEVGWMARNTDKIIPFKPGHKTVKYHPRTVLAKMAFDAGVPLQLIAASYGVIETKKQEPTYAHHD
jgi:hypothetical protein